MEESPLGCRLSGGPLPEKAREGGHPFFHHKPSVNPITDAQPTMRNNGNLIGAATRFAVNEDGLRSCPKAIFGAI